MVPTVVNSEEYSVDYIPFFHGQGREIQPISYEEKENLFRCADKITQNAFLNITKITYDIKIQL